MKWIHWVLWKIQSGHDSVHRRTFFSTNKPTWCKSADGQGETSMLSERYNTLHKTVVTPVGKQWSYHNRVLSDGISICILHHSSKSTISSSILVLPSSLPGSWSPWGLASCSPSVHKLDRGSLHAPSSWSPVNTRHFSLITNILKNWKTIHNWVCIFGSQRSIVHDTDINYIGDEFLSKSYSHQMGVYTYRSKFLHGC